MRGFVPAYDLVTPGHYEEALGLLAAGAKPFAGGTDLMVRLEAGELAERCFVSLLQFEELRGIDVFADKIRIGALTTYTEIQAADCVRKEFPMLAAAARETGGVAIQNRGTIGGNIANASPAADCCPVLLAYDATLLLRSLAGTRQIRYQDFHTGYKQTVLFSGEVIEAVLLPRRESNWRDHFRKVGARRAQAIAKLNFAACAQLHEGRIVAIRIAFGGVAATPLRCLQTEQEVLEGSAFALAEIHPISDFRSTAEYRNCVAHNLLGDFLKGLKS